MKCKVVVSVTLLLIGATLYAQEKVPADNIDTPFNVHKVIESASRHRRSQDDIAGLDNIKHPEHSSHEIRDGEFLIDTNVVYGPAAGPQYVPAVAFDGTNYLVVWDDFRSGDDIYGARVDQSGNILDTVGIAISTAASSQRYPSVAFDGINYLVVWQDHRSGPYSEYLDIYGARVDQSGNVLDTAGIAISTAADWQRHPSIAFDGTNYLVVWMDRRSGSGSDIYGARIDQSGNVLDTAGIAISTGTYWEWHPSVASNGTNSLVVWQDERSGSDSDIYGARIDQSGNVLDPAGIAISTAEDDQWHASVAFDGTNYLVVWQDYSSDSPDIYGARVDQSGAVLDPTGITISTAEGPQGNPSVFFDSINFLVVWSDARSGSGSDIYGARIDQSGNVLDTAGIAISTAASVQMDPAVAFDGTNYLVVWSDCRSVSPDIYGARVDQAANVLDPTGIAISIAPYSQWQPGIAFNGTNYLVVWEDYRNDPAYSDIYGTRVDQSGNVLDPACIAIATATGDQEYPAVASNGTDYLIVWQDHFDIYGTRVDQSGNVLDTVGIPISTATDDQAVPSVAFDSTNYLVVWTDFRSGSSDIYGARIDQSGSVLDTAGIAISTAAQDQLWPSVTFDGTNYLVVWSDARSGGLRDIYGARVDQSGNVLDTTGIAISVTSYDKIFSSVAFDGTNYLVVWQDRRGTNYEYEIYGARVDQSGNVLDTAGIAISIAANDQCYPSAVFNGTNCLIVWQDWRSGSDDDIYSARVDQSGNVLDPTGIAISLQSGNQWNPAVAHGTADSILITYSGWTDSINNHPANTMRIWGKFYPFVGIKENALGPTPYAQRLLRVYPNPFRQMTDIRYQVDSRQYVVGSISIYDISGRLVRQWDYTTMRLSDHIMWHGDDDAGHQLPAGVFFCRLKTDKFATTRKIVKLK